MEELLLANALLTLLERLIPRIEKLAQSGEVPTDEQQAQLDRYRALRAKVGKPFEGPEWEQAPDWPSAQPS